MLLYNCPGAGAADDEVGGIAAPTTGDPYCGVEAFNGVKLAFKVDVAPLTGVLLWRSKRFGV